AAMKENRQADASTFLRSFAIRAFEFETLLSICRQFQRTVHQALQIEFILNDLAGRHAVTFVKEIASAYFGRVNPKFLRGTVHVRLESESRLRSTETAEGPVGYRVGFYDPAMNAREVAFVRSPGVQGCARQNYRRKSRICAAVEHKINIEGQQCAVA